MRCAKGYLDGALMAAITAALPKEDEATTEIGQHRPLNFLTATADPPVLRAAEGDLARAVERLWSLLLMSNRTHGSSAMLTRSMGCLSDVIRTVPTGPEAGRIVSFGRHLC